jgi:hypothetical protein
MYLNLKAFSDDPKFFHMNSPLLPKDLGVEAEMVGTQDCFIKYKDLLL